MALWDKIYTIVAEGYDENLVDLTDKIIEAVDDYSEQASNESTR